MTINVLNRDKELFDRIAEGSESAFRELFHLYAPEIRPLAFKLTKSAHIVDDIVQNLFFKIWMSRDILSTIETPRSWILKVAFHECFSYLRKKSVRDRKENEPFKSSPLEQGNHVSDNIEFKDALRLLDEAINKLPRQAKTVYELSRKEGFTLQQIANQMGLSLQTVKNTTSRALKGIRDYLRENDIIIPLFFLWYYPF